MEQTNHIYHKIRGSYPGYIGIELPNDYQVLIMDEENFNAFRKEESYQALYPQIKHHYCHFQKPVDGSWYVVIKAEETYFNPSRINIIYKSESSYQGLSTSSSKPISPISNSTHPEAFMP